MESPLFYYIHPFTLHCLSFLSSVNHLPPLFPLSPSFFLLSEMIFPTPRMYPSLSCLSVFARDRITHYSLLSQREKERKRGKLIDIGAKLPPGFFTAAWQTRDTQATTFSISLTPSAALAAKPNPPHKWSNGTSVWPKPFQKKCERNFKGDTFENKSIICPLCTIFYSVTPLNPKTKPRTHTSLDGQNDGQLHQCSHPQPARLDDLQSVACCWMHLCGWLAW